MLECNLLRIVLADFVIKKNILLSFSWNNFFFFLGGWGVGLSLKYSNNALCFCLTKMLEKMPT